MSDRVNANTNAGSMYVAMPMTCNYHINLYDNYSMFASSLSIPVNARQYAIMCSQSSVKAFEEDIN